MGRRELNERQILRALGEKWKQEIPAWYQEKMYDRVSMFRRQLDVINRYLPEYREGGYAVLDFSCGPGSLLELMRHFGNTILGTDVAYFEFLEAQGIPYLKLNGRQMPYPFEDRSYDLVTCTRSIQTYKYPYRDVITEFCRIARKRVLLDVNFDYIYEAQKDDLVGWAPEGWRLDLHHRSVYRYSRQ